MTLDDLKTKKLIPGEVVWISSPKLEAFFIHKTNEEYTFLVGSEGSLLCMFTA